MAHPPEYGLVRATILFSVFRRVVFAAVAALAVLLLAAAVYPQGSSDLVGVLQDMRNTLKEFNTRLQHVEQLVKELPKKERKHEGGREQASGNVVPTPPASSLTLAQESYERGRVAEASGNYGPAIEAYSSALQLDPRNDAAFMHRANSYFHAGRLDLALSDLNQSLAIQPDNSQAYELRSRVYRVLKDYPHAVEDLDQALKRNPDAQLFLERADLDEERGYLKNAIAVYGTALERQPGSPGILLKRAAVLKQLNEVDRAITDCAAAIAAGPRLAEGYLCRADCYVRMGVFPAAIEDLNAALKLKPDSAEAGNMIAAVRNLVALNEGAKKVVPPAPAVASAPPPRPVEPAAVAPAAVAPAVVAHAPQSNPTAAPAPNPPASPPPVVVTAPSVPVPVRSTPAAQERASVTPVTPPPPSVVTDAAKLKEAKHFIFVGRTKIAEGKFDEAIQSLTEAIQIDPSSDLAYNSRGYAYLRSLRYQEARDDFTTALRLNPNYANAHLNLGATLQLMGLEGGKEHLRRAAALQKEAEQTSPPARKPPDH